MLDKILAGNGLGITISGILFIFLGLIAIAIVISLFNLYFNKREGQSKKEEAVATEQIETTDISEIPEDELAAIAAAIETYRRIHYTEMLKQITFKHGDSRTPWKTSQKFSNRQF